MLGMDAGLREGCLLGAIDGNDDSWLRLNQNGDFTGIYVKAGELIGYVGEQSLDFGVYNYNNPLDFINPEAYESLEPWKIYTDDPFLYFPDDIRGNLLKKMMRYYLGNILIITWQYL